MDEKNSFINIGFIVNRDNAVVHLMKSSFQNTFAKHSFILLEMFDVTDISIIRIDFLPSRNDTKTCQGMVRIKNTVLEILKIQAKQENKSIRQHYFDQYRIVEGEVCTWLVSTESAKKLVDHVVQQRSGLGNPIPNFQLFGSRSNGSHNSHTWCVETLSQFEINTEIVSLPHYESALAYYKKILYFDSEDADSYWNIANILEQLEKPIGHSMWYLLLASMHGSSSVQRKIDSFPTSYVATFEKMTSLYRSLQNPVADLSEVPLEPPLIPYCLLNAPSQLAHLQELHITGTLKGITRPDFSLLIDALNVCVVLNVLNLTDNKLTDEHIVPTICKFLKKKPSLTTIDLSRNHLVYESLHALICSIEQHQKLTLVNFSNNHISLAEANVDIISHRLAQREIVGNQTVLNIDFSENYVTDNLSERLITFGFFRTIQSERSTTSLICSEASITSEQYLIFIFRNLQAQDPEHAMILIEGLTVFGQRFLEAHDFRPEKDPPKGKVCGPTIFQPTRTHREREYYRYIGFSVPKITADKLRGFIDTDRDKHLFYKSLPNSSGGSSSSFAGHTYNCLTWAALKLREAGINCKSSYSIPSLWLRHQKIKAPALLQDVQEKRGCSVM